MTKKEGWCDVVRDRPIEERVGVAVMVALVIITLINVLVRYFTNGSFAWTEEISVFLLIVMTLAGAAMAAREDAHIRIDFFYRSSRNGRRSWLAILSALATTTLFTLLAVLLLRAGWDEFDLGETTPGLGWPRWWYTVWMPPLALLVAVQSINGYQRQAKDRSQQPAEGAAP